MAMDRWRPFGSVERWDPFRGVGVGDIQTEVNRLFDNFSGRTKAGADPTWLPAVDIHETKDDIVLSFDIPGVSEKDVQVSITGDLLTVRGERRFERESSDSYHRVERLYGRFERSVQLPMVVQTDKVKASYRDGVLTIHLPKAEEVKPREIKIDVL